MLHNMTPKELAAISFRLATKTPQVAGVYLIYCHADEKGYIGSTTRVYMRLYGHRAKLRKGKHANPHLQAAFNKYGLSTFSFLTVEVCPGATPEYLLARENHYLLQMDRKQVFNMAIPATLGGPVGVTRSPEHRAAVGRAQRGNSWAKGMKHTDEWKAAASARLKGKKQSPEQIAAARAGKLASFEANPTIYQGDRNGRAKLSDDDVREIRRLYAAKEATQVELGRRFNVNQISVIVLRKQWGHLPD